MGVFRKNIALVTKGRPRWGGLCDVLTIRIRAMTISAFGLILDIVGALLLILADLKSEGASIALDDGEIKGGFLKLDAIKFAKKYGSRNSLDQENLVVDTYPLKLWGFTLLLLGFACQFFGSNFKNFILFCL